MRGFILNINNQPLVSVHLPVYNIDQYIIDALESILNQTYENIEICIGDNASTDKTIEILKTYKKKYPDKIKLVLNDINLGFAGNCNKVLDLCSGEFVAFFHGDDLMEPEKIEKQVDFMLSHAECALCYHDVYIIDKDGAMLGTAFQSTKPREGGLEVLLKHATFCFISFIMVKRSSIPKHGFRAKYSAHADTPLYIDVLESGGTINYLNSLLGSYRRHGKNASCLLDLEQQVDSFSRIAFGLLKHPKYFPRFIKDISIDLIAYRFANERINYIYYVRAALKLRVSWKNYARLVVYYITNGRCKL